jgi:murein DD-endopeptidase MepM/ murein hydrolase activator NlpD
VRLAAAITIVAFGLAAVVRPAPGAPAMLAGLLPCTADVEARWPQCSAWVFPVGDSLDFERACADEPGYRVNRGVLTRAADGAQHDGADLANGRAGGPVRAAADGIVVLVSASSGGGYGSNIVIAHRLADGALAYTVYAHLLEGSSRVREGAAVCAGETIARVGQTGRATTPHLHFEVRTVADSTARWEKCPIEDPVEFVRMRLPEARHDLDWAAPYLAWAEFAALVPHGLDATMTLDAAMLSEVLERAGLRDAAAPGDGKATAGKGDRDAPDWNLIARALAAIGTRAKRLPPCSIEPRRYSSDCIERLGVRRPARELHRLAERATPPTLGELCLALADFTARAPDPDRKRSRTRSAR